MLHRMIDYRNRAVMLRTLAAEGPPEHKTIAATVAAQYDRLADALERTLAPKKAAISA